MSRAYRNPTFSYVHALRDVGINGVAASGWTEDARFWDGQSRVLAVSTGTGFNTLDFDRGVSTSNKRTTRELDRLIVPKGHNLHGNKVAFATFEESAVFGSATHRQLLDGLAQSFMHPSSDLALWDFDSAASASLGYDAGMRFVLTPTGKTPAETGDLGEIWWTKREQTATGIVQAWTEEATPFDLRLETPAGVAFVVEQGTPLRTFALEHRGVSGADLLLYEELLRYTRLGRRSFWYEHPSGANEDQLVGDTTSTSNWSPSSPATLALDAGYLEMTAIGTGEKGIFLDEAFWPADAPRDWRGHIFQVDLVVDENTGSWADADAHAIYLRITTAADKYTEYDFAAPFVGQIVTGQNYRIQVDLDNDATGVGADLPADLTNIESFAIVADFANAANQIKIANPRVISKTSRPHLVEIVGRPTIRQDRQRPTAGPEFTIAFDMLEVAA